jgi:RecA/RadA recombinase
LDNSFGLNNEIGFPLHTMEMYGVTFLGKSTIAYSLSSHVTNLLGLDGWTLLDVEGFDPTYLNTIATSLGMTDEQFIHSVGGKGATTEDKLAEFISCMKEDGIQVGMLDSVGAISPAMEQANDPGSANMGRRALLMHQLGRKILPKASSYEVSMILVNHFYPKMGTKSWDTPGGNGIKYLCGMRVHLSRVSGKEYADGSYLVQGKVVKNRWGGAVKAGTDVKPKTFNLFVKAGYGVHVGLTALFDLVDLKVLKSKGSVTHLETGEKLGRLKAKWILDSDNQDFSVFTDMLDKEYSKRGVKVGQILTPPVGKTQKEMLAELGF